MNRVFGYSLVAVSFALLTFFAAGCGGQRNDPLTTEQQVLLAPALDEEKPIIVDIGEFGENIPIMFAGVEPAGKVILGTVKGDLHDIGKNLVAMMLEGAGFEVIDLGIDVAPEKFAEAVKQDVFAIVIATSTTTDMATLEATVKAIGQGKPGISIICIMTNVNEYTKAG